MWHLLALALFGLLTGACGGAEHSCTLKACGGGPAPLRLIDEAGALVAARGEYRTNREPPEQWPFDCTVGPRASDSDADCTNNMVTLHVYDQGPSTVLQMRFQLVDGGWSEWQGVPLAFEEHTDPDFNGPGCPCTWHTVTAEPVVVPSGAHLTDPNDLP